MRILLQVFLLLIKVKTTDSTSHFSTRSRPGVELTLIFTPALKLLQLLVSWPLLWSLHYSLPGMRSQKFKTQMQSCWSVKVRRWLSEGLVAWLILLNCVISWSTSLRCNITAVALSTSNTSTSSSTSTNLSNISSGIICSIGYWTLH